jgi:hypothetical protein
MNHKEFRKFLHDQLDDLLGQMDDQIVAQHNVDLILISDNMDAIDENVSHRFQGTKECYMSHEGNWFVEDSVVMTKEVKL